MKENAPLAPCSIIFKPKITTGSCSAEIREGGRDSVKLGGYCLHDWPCLEMPAFEIILRLALQLSGNRI